MATPLLEALDQVRQLREAMLSKQRFKGYSGRARALAGTLAGVVGFGLTLVGIVQPLHLLLAWGGVFFVAAGLNYGALLYWFLTDPTVDRDTRRLRPALEVFPVLFCGAILTVLLAQMGQFDALYILWMALFGLTQFTARGVVPPLLPLIGWYYLGCAAMLVAFPPGLFASAWIMGLVFFVGEWLGGVILHFDGARDVRVRDFFRLRSGSSRRAPATPEPSTGEPPHG